MRRGAAVGERQVVAGFGPDVRGLAVMDRIGLFRWERLGALRQYWKGSLMYGVECFGSLGRAWPVLVSFGPVAFVAAVSVRQGQVRFGLDWRCQEWQLRIGSSVFDLVGFVMAVG